MRNDYNLTLFIDRSCVPEPLCRVLEPSVSVTYLDQSDHGDVHDILRSSKHLEPILNEKDEDNITDGDEDKETSHFQRELNAGAIIYKLEKKDASQTCKLLLESIVIVIDTHNSRSRYNESDSRPLEDPKSL